MVPWNTTSVCRQVFGLSVVALLVCSGLVPETASAQTSRAMALMGQFAVGVATTVAGTLLSNRAEAYLDPGQKTRAAPPNTPVNPPPSSAPSPPSSAPLYATPPVTRTPPPPLPPRGYRFSLEWRLLGDVYSGTLVIRGNEGLFRVTTPLGQVIDQDVSARGDGNVVWLVGHNPRLAASTTPALGYSADSFRLVRNAVGDWVFADVCDANVCAPVYVTDASTF